MAETLITRQEVQRRVGLSRAYIYKLMRRGRFPVPLKISVGAVRWRESEIEAWIDSRPRAVSEAQAAVA